MIPGLGTKIPPAPQCDQKKKKEVKSLFLAGQTRAPGLGEHSSQFLLSAPTVSVCPEFPSYWPGPGTQPEAPLGRRCLQERVWKLVLNGVSKISLGFPGGSVGKESACNLGDLGLIPGLERSAGWKDPLEEGMATHSSILDWRIPVDRGTWWAAVHGVTKSWT